MPKLYSGNCPICQKPYVGVSPRFYHKKCWLSTQEHKQNAVNHFKIASKKNHEFSLMRSPIIRICKQCHKPYIYKLGRGGKYYCSPKCYHLSQIKKKPCPTCGKMFSGSKKYCSINCLPPKNKNETTCSFCGKKFNRWVDKKHNKHYFCCAKCRLMWQSQRNSGAGNPNYRGGNKSRICKYCGKKYMVPPSRGGSNYCSRECAGMKARRIKASKCYEREARKILESDAFYVMRSAGSLGAFDLIAVNGDLIRLIQIKSTSKKTWKWQDYAHDINAMSKISSPSISMKEIWVREIRGEWVFGFCDWRKMYRKFKEGQ